MKMIKNFNTSVQNANNECSYNSTYTVKKSRFHTLLVASDLNINLQKSFPIVFYNFRALDDLQWSLLDYITRVFMMCCP